MDADAQCCWICYDKSPVEDLIISPCACKGTCTYVHAKCLRRWVRVTLGNRSVQRGPSPPRCPQCRTEFDLAALRRHTGDEEDEDCPWPRGKGPVWRLMSQEHRLVFAAWLLHPLFHFVLITLAATVILFLVSHFAYARFTSGPGEVIPFGKVLIFGFPPNATTAAAVPYRSTAKEVVHRVFEWYYSFFFGTDIFPVSDWLQDWWTQSGWGVHERWSSYWAWISTLMATTTVMRRTFSLFPVMHPEMSGTVLGTVLCGGTPQTLSYKLHDAAGMLSVCRNLCVVYVLPLLRPKAVLLDTAFVALMTVGSSMAMAMLFIITCVWASLDLWSLMRSNYVAVRACVRASWD